MASWFKRKGDEEVEVQPGDDSTESTIEVKAQVIADAVRAAEPQSQQVGAQAGIAADGLVTGSDFEQPADVPVTLESTQLDQVLAERKSLVQLCLYALDRARSAGVAERLEEGLASVGVDAIRPDGVRFDPAYHEAGGTVSTADETLDGLVAETEVVGFSDRGDVLRVPIVTVYSKSAS